MPHVWHVMRVFCRAEGERTTAADTKQAIALCGGQPPPPPPGGGGGIRIGFLEFFEFF